MFQPMRAQIGSGDCWSVLLLVERCVEEKHLCASAMEVDLTISERILPHFFKHGSRITKRKTLSATVKEACQAKPRFS